MVYVQLAVLLLVFQQRVPLSGVVVSPVLESVKVPAPEPVSVTLVIGEPEPTVNGSGFSEMAGEPGVVRMLPDKLPVLTILAAGQGTVVTVQASTCTGVGHKLAVPG